MTSKLWIFPWSWILSSEFFRCSNFFASVLAKLCELLFQWITWTWKVVCHFMTRHTVTVWLVSIYFYSEARYVLAFSLYCRPAWNMILSFQATKKEEMRKHSICLKCISLIFKLINQLMIFFYSSPRQIRQKCFELSVCAFARFLWIGFEFASALWQVAINRHAS